MAQPMGIAGRNVKDECAGAGPIAWFGEAAGIAAAGKGKPLALQA